MNETGDERAVYVERRERLLFVNCGFAKAKSVKVTTTTTTTTVAEAQSECAVNCK